MNYRINKITVKHKIKLISLKRDSYMKLVVGITSKDQNSNIDWLEVVRVEIL